MKNMINNAQTLDFITEQDMTPERLGTMLSMAYLQTEVDGDGDIVISDEYNVILTINPRTKLLWFRIYFQEITDVPRSTVESAIIRANDQTVFGNLQLGENYFYSDTFLDYRNGLPAHTIVFTVRRLMSTTSTLMNRVLDEVHDGEGDSAN